MKNKRRTHNFKTVGQTFASFQRVWAILVWNSNDLHWILRSCVCACVCVCEQDCNLLVFIFPNSVWFIHYACLLCGLESQINRFAKLRKCFPLWVWFLNLGSCFLVTSALVKICSSSVEFQLYIIPSKKENFFLKSERRNQLI